MSENGWKREGTAWARAGAAGGLGLLAALLLMLLLSGVAADQILPEGREGLAAHGALLLGAVAAGLLARKRSGEGRGRLALAAGGVMLLGVLLLGVFTTASSMFNLSTLLSALCVIFGVLLGSVLGGRRPRRRRRRR